MRKLCKYCIIWHFSSGMHRNQNLQVKVSREEIRKLSVLFQSMLIFTFWHCCQTIEIGSIHDWNSIMSTYIKVDFWAFEEVCVTTDTCIRFSLYPVMHSNVFFFLRTWVQYASYYHYFPLCNMLFIGSLNEHKLFSPVFVFVVVKN